MHRVFSLALLAAALMHGQQRNFIACPIIRDTNTVPCYLAEYEGETYFLGVQQDTGATFHPPQLKHEVLVEGTVAEGPRICGGIPLQPVAISVIREVNLNCNTLLPAEPGIEAPTRNMPSPSRESFTGTHEFTILYPFDDDTPGHSGNVAVTEAAAYAKRINASSVKISGYRAITLLSNGNSLVEKPELAQKRARNIQTLLEGLHVQHIGVEWDDKAEPGDGRSDFSRRRVTILVTP